MATAIFKLDELSKFTQKITSKGVLRKMMNEIKTYMVTSTQKKIATGDIRGDKTLSDFTLSMRRKKSNIPLSDTGRLRMSIQGIVKDGTRIIIGSPLSYSSIHQTGGTITRDSGDGKLYIPASKITKKLSEQTGVRKTISKLKSEGWNIFHTNRAVLGLSPADKKKIKGTSEQRKTLSRKYQQLLFIKKESVNIKKREYLYVSEKNASDILKITENVLMGAVK